MCMYAYTCIRVSNHPRVPAASALVGKITNRKRKPLGIKTSTYVCMYENKAGRMSWLNHITRNESIDRVQILMTNRAEIFASRYDNPIFQFL